MIRSGVCITEYKGNILAWVDNNSKIDRLSVTKDDKDITGNIYIGRVKRVVKNLEACFVEFEEDILGFLSFNDIYPSKNVKEGDELVVQVVKEASKSKEAVLTTHLSLAGDYCVVIYDIPKVNISRKISGEITGELRRLVPEETEFCITIRTNAASVQDRSVVTDEINRLCDTMRSILDISNTRKAPAILYHSEPEYVRFIRGLEKKSYERIITDKKDIYDVLNKSFDCELYTDDYPLAKLYSIETKINELLSKKIWLKSGGNLVIEYTEALTVIDVNSAKNIAKKDREDNILLLNKEAAVEIARQIRLRNISGMIIIDFINMHTEEAKKELIDHVKRLLLADSVRCDYVDITKLGLMELVRRKIKPPIYELFK